MSSFLDLTHYQRWDIAGIDGLQMAKLLFGNSVDRLAPFQSLETHFDDQICSVLRLCENNFRVSLQKGQSLEQKIQILPKERGWIKQFPWLSAIALPETIGLSLLPSLAIPKPPHRLNGLLPNCAIPARIDGISVLIWRHAIAGQPAFELHTATQDIESIKTRLIRG